LNLDEYVEESGKYLNSEMGAHERLEMAAMGLAGEIGELLDLYDRSGPELNKQKVVEELGDCFWYAARLLDYTGIPGQDFLILLKAIKMVDETKNERCGPARRRLLAAINAARLLEIVKKEMFQGHALDVEAFKINLAGAFYNLMECAFVLGICMQEILDQNLSKLAARYPTGKFKPEDSINRK
jgi:NTP pyrophosphatase (non-canonical NTP hydrolase)